MFFPYALMMMSFLRSVMRRNPSSNTPMSPVWNHPSGSIACDVASGLLKYPCMMCGPRERISPSSAIFTSTPGISGPTDPMRRLVGEFTAMTGEVSVRP